MMLYLRKLVFLLFCFPSISSAQFSVIQKNDGLLIKEDDQEVLFYVTEDRTLNGEHARAHYIHPLYNLSGYTLTEDFPPDHVHQRGIFWAWHQVYVGKLRMGNAWLVKDFSWEVENAQHDTQKDKALVHSSVLWKSAKLTDDLGNRVPILNEQCTITVHKKTLAYRVVDFHITFLPLQDSVFIGGSGDIKGYGGFSARLKLPAGVQFVSTQGKVQPKTESVQAGGWMDIQLKKEPREGIILMDHPGNPGYPNPWILREKNSMQNIKYPGRTPLKLDHDDPLTLKYRLIVYQSPLEASEIKKLGQF